MLRLVIILTLFLYTLSPVRSQISPPISLDELDTRPSLQTLFEKIETQSGYFISYNPSSIDLGESILLKSGDNILDIEEVLNQINNQLGYEYDLEYSSKKLILYPRKFKYITGIIRDSASLETLPGVTIYTPNSDGYTNEEGYFSIRVDNADETAYVSLLGYQTQKISLDNAWKTNVIIQLVYDNRLPEIIIQGDTQVAINPPDASPRNIPIDNQFGARGKGGTVDAISEIKKLPGVSIGSEAQNGFTVRGGGPDQNLVLLDGLPIYEVSHLGGLTSIFMENTIKKSTLYKGAIPARFGGKLSSVLDIRLKDGNRNEYKRQLSLGLENISGSIEGPIGEKTSFIISGRLSLFNLYTKPILKANFNVLDSDLTYDDVFTKISHWVNPSNRLSISAYRGRDNLKLSRTNLPVQGGRFNDNNDINWSNNLISVNWKKLISENVFMHTQLGRATFNFNSSSSQSVVDSLKTGINANSCQSNYSGNINLDIYTDTYGKIKAGLGMIQHQTQPSIILQPVLNNHSCGDSTYLSNELYGFIENRLEFSDSWSLNLGLRINNFYGLDTNYFKIQPRFNLQYLSSKNQFNFGYSGMNQFLHLLVSPSSGLPSDIWVPSTNTVAPQVSHLLSMGYSRKLSRDLSFSLGLFYNRYLNIIEYTNPSELFLGIEIDRKEFNIETTQIDWEERISNGTGVSQGVELAINYKKEKLSLNLAYTYSKSERSITNSEGVSETFRYKFDRPHDLSLSLDYLINPQNYFSISWVYTNGNRWTYKDKRISIFEDEILVASSRNNTRLPDYHHLDFSYTHIREIVRPDDFELTIGIYNAYNRKNPFLAYQVIGPGVPLGTTSQLSLYHLIPQINAKFRW